MGRTLCCVRAVCTCCAQTWPSRTPQREPPLADHSSIGAWRMVVDPRNVDAVDTQITFQLWPLRVQLVF